MSWADPNDPTRTLCQSCGSTLLFHSWWAGNIPAGGGWYCEDAECVFHTGPHPEPPKVVTDRVAAWMAEEARCG
jgi:hypothetical protein